MGGSTEDTDAYASDAHRRLLSDPAALDHLWRTRGIDTVIATRFRLGITGTPGDRFWTLPLTNADGRAFAVKGHCADGQSQKSWWKPSGTKREHVWPVSLDGDGPVWCCPGELKALAVIGLGLPAIGITSGEGSAKSPTGVPVAALELLRGRSAAIPPDDDGPGVAWGDYTRRQFVDAGIDARIVDLDLDRSAGTKDIGDRIVCGLIEDAKEPAAVAATLLDRYARADPWYGTSIGDIWSNGSMWRPVTYIPTGLASLDNALGGGFRTRGGHLIVGKPGKAKTQLATTIAVNVAQRNIPTALFSLELESDELAQLVAAQLGDIPRLALALGKVDGDHTEKLRTVQS